MTRTFLSLPYEIKYKILSEAIGVSVDYVFKSGTQVQECRDKAIAEGWDIKAYGLGQWYCLTVRVIPTKTLTGYLLVSHEFSKVFSKVVADMDKLASKFQEEISKSTHKGGLPPCTYFGWREVFDRMWDDEKPCRIILGNHPQNHWYFLAQITSMTSMRSLYFTKAMTGWGYSKFKKLWRPHYTPSKFDGISWIAIFLSGNLPCLETIAIGVGKKIGLKHRNSLPIIQMLRWLIMKPRTGQDFEHSHRLREILIRRPPRFRRLELVFEKKGKGIENSLDLNSYVKAPDGHKWAKTRLNDRDITRRGRYIKQWDDFTNTEVWREEEGDVLQIELQRLADAELSNPLHRPEGNDNDVTYLLETFPLSITTTFE
ncbi:uncharacterized protein DFL_008985 [Arthrobotrys flagrans]|uniref:Uncharacterized protein n=1 Tax=Arthrobotrys flagrans TaxID=97331 RepID=A0A436ZQB2_ARTFL|nr:hypothetical protein DFL_008985 [Arthrobotrys flagrans]